MYGLQEVAEAVAGAEGQDQGIMQSIVQKKPLHTVDRPIFLVILDVQRKLVMCLTTHKWYLVTQLVGLEMVTFKLISFINAVHLASIVIVLLIVPSVLQAIIYINKPRQFKLVYKNVQMDIMAAELVVLNAHHLVQHAVQPQPLAILAFLVISFITKNVIIHVLLEHIQVESNAKAANHHAQHVLDQQQHVTLAHLLFCFITINALIIALLELIQQEQNALNVNHHVPHVLDLQQPVQHVFLVFIVITIDAILNVHLELIKMVIFVIHACHLAHPAKSLLNSVNLALMAIISMKINAIQNVQMEQFKMGKIVSIVIQDVRNVKQLLIIALNVKKDIISKITNVICIAVI